ncbi:MAG: hypothetical protein F6K41_32710, partial [Symploca sp. SIO3E6]|nr:hypothetical protein [Caldora sp. SIO3E6]
PSTDVRPQPTCALNRRAPSTDVLDMMTCDRVGTNQYCSVKRVWGVWGVWGVWEEGKRGRGIRAYPSSIEAQISYSPLSSSERDARTTVEIK